MSKISSSDRCAATYGFIDGKCRCALGAGHAGDHQYSLIEPPAPLLQYELGFAQQLEGERLRIDYYGRSHTMRVDHWLDAAWQWNGETRATHEPPDKQPVVGVVAGSNLARQIQLARKAIDGWPNDVRAAMGVEPRAGQPPAPDATIKAAAARVEKDLNDNDYVPEYAADLRTLIAYARSTQPPGADATRLKQYFDHANCISHPSLYYSSEKPFDAWRREIDEYSTATKGSE